MWRGVAAVGGAQLALELDRDDVQGVNVRMSGEALVPCG